MAHILVYIELDGGRPAGPSLEALGEARRIASHLGATLYAVVPSAEPPSWGDDDVVAVLGRHGADKVVLCPGPPTDAPSLHATHGHVLAAAAERFPPTLVLLAGTPGGRDLGPRLAARLAAAYFADPTVERSDHGDLVLARAVHGGTHRRRLAADDVERPVVATLPSGSCGVAAGDEEAEVVLLDTAPPPAAVAELERAPDPGAALDGARVVVTAGAGVSPELFPLVEELARALGGEVGVTRTARAGGLGGSEREIGAGGRRVAPRLYIACGASGSAAHLGAVSPGAHVVALTRDPAAPIVRLAGHALVGELADTLPALIAALRDGARFDARGSA